MEQVEFQEAFHDTIWRKSCAAATVRWENGTAGRPAFVPVVVSPFLVNQPCVRATDCKLDVTSSLHFAVKCACCAQAEQEANTLATSANLSLSMSLYSSCQPLRLDTVWKVRREVESGRRDANVDMESMSYIATAELKLSQPKRLHVLHL